MTDVTKHIRAEKFSFSMRLKSFHHAFSGLKTMLITEHNSRVHFVFTITALLSGFVFGVSIAEFSILVIAIAIVWIAELFNTCIEKVMDFLTMDKHPEIKRIKDMAAAAVMLASASALIVGAVIFIPKILKYVTLSL